MSISRGEALDTPERFHIIMPTDTASTVSQSSRSAYRHVTMTMAVLLVAMPTIVLFPGLGHLADGLRTDVTTGSLLAFACVAVAGGVVKGVSGFGDSLLVTPVAALIIDPSLAVVVLAIPSHY